LNREEKKILGVTASAHNLVHIYEGILPPLIPILLAEFSTDYFHLGMVVTIFSYAFGMGAIPAGYLSDRMNPKQIITVFLLGAGALSVLVLMANTLIVYAIIMGCMGLFCSLYHPAANTLISHTFREKGKAFAMNGIAGSFGIAVIPLLSAWIGALLGWQIPYVLFGLLGMAVGGIALTIPQQTGAVKQTEAEEKEPFGPEKVPYLTLFLFYTTAVLLGLTYRGTMTFLPAYIGQYVQLGFLNLDTVAVGGMVATIALVFGGIGQYVAGHFVDRYKPEKIYFITNVFGTIWLFAMAESVNLILAVSSMLFAFFYFATQPVQNFLISTNLPKHRRGLGFGIHFFLVFSVGSTAAAISGYLADRFGLVSVFHAMAICSLISSVLSCILLLRTRTNAPG